MLGEFVLVGKLGYLRLLHTGQPCSRYDVSPSLGYCTYCVYRKGQIYTQKSDEARNQIFLLGLLGPGIIHRKVADSTGKESCFQ